MGASRRTTGATSSADRSGRSGCPARSTPKPWAATGRSPWPWTARHPRSLSMVRSAEPTRCGPSASASSTVRKGESGRATPARVWEPHRVWTSWTPRHGPPPRPCRRSAGRRSPLPVGARRVVAVRLDPLAVPADQGRVRPSRRRASAVKSGSPWSAATRGRGTVAEPCRTRGGAAEGRGTVATSFSGARDSPGRPTCSPGRSRRDSASSSRWRPHAVPPPGRSGRGGCASAPLPTAGARSGAGELVEGGGALRDPDRVQGGEGGDPGRRADGAGSGGRARRRGRGGEERSGGPFTVRERVHAEASGPSGWARHVAEAVGGRGGVPGGRVPAVADEGEHPQSQCAQPAPGCRGGAADEAPATPPRPRRAAVSSGGPPAAWPRRRGPRGCRARAR
ncbi:Uncharacterised protein [Streptomyces griseus]|uniref:Uncharacterized protein n=1 Tax=Streptomyces griseus TaxID=1911 RepID=A0A380NBV7_STRGR|nr:Uncharacterised protein [Streptomyces griseus]